jgi:hypothetical protein
MALTMALPSGPHVKDVFAYGLVQHRGARGWPNQRHVVFVKNRNGALAMRRARVRNMATTFFFLNQLFGIFSGELGLELVDHGDQFNFLTVHAAFGVDRIDIQFRALGGFRHTGTDGTGEAGRLADKDLVITNLA